MGSFSSLFNCPCGLSYVPVRATSREVGCSPEDLKRLNNISVCGHRDLKILGDGLRLYIDRAE